MEVYKYRIKRTNPSIYWTVPCTGGTDFWPINSSSNCSGTTMYNSTFSQVQNALQGDMNTFPQELTGCSLTNPCVILNDTTTMPMLAPPPPVGNVGNPSPSPFCLDIESHPYILFTGLNLIQSGVQTFTSESYNDMISVFDITNSSLSAPLNTQTNAHLTPNITPCFCQSPLGTNLNQIPIMLDQDFNDIGHYDIWDGNIGQKDIFSNFVVSAVTSAGNKIKIWNSTDFGYYKSFQDSPYTIDWGDCNCNCLTPPCQNSFLEPCCETLQFPNLTNPLPHTYAGVGTRRIRITHESPWGPTSVSQAISVPFMNYNALLATGNIPSFVSPVIGPGGPVGTNAYFGAYPFSPLDSGTDILQYSGMSPIFAGGNNTNCFDVTGNTQSLLGAFQSYTSLSTGNLPPGYQVGVTVPLMGDVLNPLTDQLENGVMGTILAENTQYTSYTISIGTNTPIKFYDFSNGVTLYEAVSCGLDAFAFGAFDCVKCEIEDCTYCETKDEYVDRISFLSHSITFNTQMGEWSPSANYVVGDIVFDSTWGDCCCYMAVKDITQSASTTSPWAGVKPTETFQGVWWFNGQPSEHIWEACSPECESCPDYTAIPCYDPLNWWNAYPTIGPPGPAGVYVNGNNYTAGTFTLGQYGNCYRALSSGTLPPPTGLTNSTYWDYIGCSSWICPPVSALTSSTVACELVPGTGITSTGPCTSQGYSSYDDCMNDFYAGDCCEDRWYCEFPYHCSGCTEISSAHPMYNDPSALDSTQGPVFQNEIDCTGWCEPPAYSCMTSTPASSNHCCGLLSCMDDVVTNNIGYYSSVILPVISSLPSTPTPYATMVDYIAATHELFFAPYTQANCDNGGSFPWYYSGCCDYTIWTYNCEEGCIPVFAGTGWTTSADCMTANPQWMGIGATPCGYECPIPCEGCVECYTTGCGNSYTPQGLLTCEMNCSCYTECYVCDCLNQQNGVNATCTVYIDPVTSLYGCPYWPPDPMGSPPTFSSATECSAACHCDGGWDCFVYASGPTQGQSKGYCNYYANLWYMNQANATWSPGAPTDAGGNPTGYTSWSACCQATECCWAKCEDDPGWLSSGYTAALQGGGGGTHPCHWYPQSVQDDSTEPMINCCSPAYIDFFGVPTGLAGCVAEYTDPVSGLMTIPFCDMVDCVGTLCPDPGSTTAMTCCGPVRETCYCACDAYAISQGLTIVTNYMGQWNSFAGYGIYETVSYGDGNTPECCWMCMCDPDPTGFGYDCTSGPPDDGPYLNGQPNCWESCERLPAYDPATPSPIMGDPCGPCDAVSGLTYSCTISGCVQSACTYSPGTGINISIYQTLNNCYTASTCSTPLVGMGNDQCRADCYCADPGPLSGGGPFEISNCTVLQDYLWDIYSPGTGNFNIFWMGYSPFPFTYPPVQPGIVFQFAGSYFWPYDSLNTCQTQLATGMFDCCDISGMTATTWDCDHTCNCPTVNGNPCIGGIGCYPVTSGPPGPFVDYTSCTEWCTWECNTAGAGVCQFVPLSISIPTYASAAACEIANTNCDCAPSPDEWWCDWAGADAGIYNTIAAQPCQQSSSFVGQGTAYQSMAIGQGAGGPSDPANNYYDAVVLGNNPTGQGFPTKIACEIMCRFCCDCAPPGTGFCDLCGDPTMFSCFWGSQYCSGSTGNICNLGPSQLSPYLCQQSNSGQYPCQAPQTEYCCHAVDGCLSYTAPYVSGSNPLTSDGVGCVQFYGTDSACGGECNFVCGDCIPAGGQCLCTFVNAPVPSCSPIHLTMALCNIWVGTLPLLNDAGSCCACYDCQTTGYITYQEWDVPTTSWVLGSTLITPMTTGAPSWTACQVYSIGDIVTHIYDGNECCYVNVWDTPIVGPPPIPLDWCVPPSFYYQAYVNDLNNNTPTWPGGGSGSMVWIPCNPSCPGINMITWDCIPGTQHDSCATLTLVTPPVTLVNEIDIKNMLSDPSGIPYLQTVNITTIKFPYGGFNAWPPNPCIENGLPLIAPTQLIIDSDMAMQNSIPASYNSWQNMIQSLASVNTQDINGNVVSLSNTYDEICEAIWLNIGSMPNSWDKCISVFFNACVCTQDLCTCNQINGPTGAFNLLANCQAALVNIPCCGSWFCYSSITPCDCVFILNDITGFSSQTECWNAQNCCEVIYPEYKCIIVTPSPMPGIIPDYCECQIVAAGTGSYTGPTALWDCENDPLTCCSATTLPDRWCCSKDCLCIVDPYGQYSTLDECHTAVAQNCCYTGSTSLYECVTHCKGTCSCVLTATGTHPTLHDCHTHGIDCCNTGVTRYDCVMGGNSICKCIPNPFGFYASFFDCKNSIPATTPHPNCCDPAASTCLPDCAGLAVTMSSTIHNGTYIPQYYTWINTPVVDKGLWVPNMVTLNPLDLVRDPYDGCCYVLVQDGCHNTNPLNILMTFAPSIVFANHLIGLYMDGSFGPAAPATPQQGYLQWKQGDSSVWWPCDIGCVTSHIIGYDCDNCPGSCQCIPNNTAGAQYTGPGALAACQAACTQGCDDCAFTLSTYLTGPITFQGQWYPTYPPAYAENDCVTDPDDKCCYCCVEDKSGPASSGPASSGPGGSGLGPIFCKSYFQPSLNIGANLGGGATWRDCQVDVNGSACTPTNPVSCLNCDTYMSTQWGATLPLAWIANPLSYQHFDIGDCVEDPNDGCCYCCMTSFGDPAVFGPNWVVDNGLGHCAIYDMAPADGIWEYYGSASGFHFNGWVSCTPTGAFPCVSTPITQKWSCIDGVCVQDGIGPYTSFANCFSSPCPPVTPPCKQCCKYLADNAGGGGGYTYQKLLSTSTPCDCEFWLGLGWTPTSWGDCCTPHQCQAGWTWNALICDCELDDGENPCIQTQACGPGEVWSWTQCKCIPGPDPTNDCLKCCVSNTTGNQIQLALNAIPCVCPVGYTETLCW